MESKSTTSERINFWSSIITLLQILIPFVWYIISLFLNSRPLQGTFKIENDEFVYVHKINKTYISDSSELKRLNSFLKKSIPYVCLDYTDNFKREYLLDVDRINCKKIQDSLTELNRILNPITYQYPFLKEMQFRIKVNIRNNSSNVLRNLKLHLAPPTSQQSLDKPMMRYIPKPYIYIDTLSVDDNGIIVSELLPGMSQTIYVWPHIYYQPNFITFSFEGGSQKIYSLKGIETRSAVDNFFTELIVTNVWLQILLYFIVPLGAIYLIFYIIPNLFRLTIKYFTKIRQYFHSVHAANNN